jgi:hypothetical protein
VKKKKRKIFNSELKVKIYLSLLPFPMVWHSKLWLFCLRSRSRPTSVFEMKTHFFMLQVDQNHGSPLEWSGRFQNLHFEKPVVLKVAHDYKKKKKKLQLFKVFRSSTRTSALKIKKFIVEATF